MYPDPGIAQVSAGNCKDRVMFDLGMMSIRLFCLRADRRMHHYLCVNCESAWHMQVKRLRLLIPVHDGLQAEIKRNKCIWWMPWHREAMKDVVRCEKRRGAANRL